MAEALHCALVFYSRLLAISRVKSNLQKPQEAGYNTTDPVSYEKWDFPTTLHKCLSPDNLSSQSAHFSTDRMAKVLLTAVIKPKPSVSLVLVPGFGQRFHSHLLWQPGPHSIPAFGAFLLGMPSSAGTGSVSHRVPGVPHCRQPGQSSGSGTAGC